MHYVNTDNNDEIVEAINAIDHSLVFSTRRKLISKMKAISFRETDRQVCDGHTYIIFEGSIDSQIVSLFFTMDLNDLNDKAYYLTEKRFYTPVRLVHLLHRDNDLPAILRYHIGERFIQCKCFSYYINGHHIRINKRDPIMLNYFNEGIQYFYDVPIEMKPNDIYMESITLKDNIIDSGVFQCGDVKFSLEKLKSILPDVEMFTLQEFIDLNERLSSEEKSLIQMVNV
jgi:hypothetical protein